MDSYGTLAWAAWIYDGLYRIITWLGAAFVVGVAVVGIFARRKSPKDVGGMLTDDRTLSDPNRTRDF